MEDKLKPEMSVKPSALWQKRQVSAWCSLVLCVNMLKCTVLRTYKTFKISSSSALGTKILAWNLKIVGNDVLLLHFFFYQFNFFDEFPFVFFSLFLLSLLSLFTWLFSIFSRLILIIFLFALPLALLHFLRVMRVQQLHYVDCNYYQASALASTA